MKSLVLLRVPIYRTHGLNQWAFFCDILAKRQYSSLTQQQNVTHLIDWGFTSLAICCSIGRFTLTLRYSYQQILLVVFFATCHLIPVKPVFNRDNNSVWKGCWKIPAAWDNSTREDLGPVPILPLPLDLSPTLDFASSREGVGCPKT